MRVSGQQAASHGKTLSGALDRTRSAEAALRRKQAHQRRLQTIHKSALATTMAPEASVCQGPFCPFVSAEQLRLQERMRRRRCFADQELIQALAALAQQQQQAPPFASPGPLSNALPPGLQAITPPPPPSPHTPEEALLRHHFRLLSFARHPVSVPGNIRSGVAAIDSAIPFGSGSTPHHTYPLQDYDDLRYPGSISGGSSSGFLPLPGPTSGRPELTASASAGSARRPDGVTPSSPPLALSTSSSPRLESSPRVSSSGAGGSDVTASFSSSSGVPVESGWEVRRLRPVRRKHACHFLWMPSWGSSEKGCTWRGEGVKVVDNIFEISKRGLERKTVV
ncbi:hypothetical protein MTO96_010219 [Rhipicephalus appendiculatus]